MKVILIIILFIVFCIGAFLLGYRTGQVESITDEVLKVYGDQIMEKIEDYYSDKEGKNNKDSNS